jgi:DNA-binding SARP family transcriptional activator
LVAPTGRAKGVLGAGLTTTALIALAIDSAAACGLGGFSMALNAPSATQALDIRTSPASVATPSVQLGLVNGFELSSDLQPVWLPLNCQRLIAFLALQDRPIQRAYVAGTMWPEASEMRAAANLRSSLWRVNRLNCRVIEAIGPLLRLASNVAVDFRKISKLVRRVLEGAINLTEADLGSIAAAGELLPDWYDADWVLVERERFRQLRLHALELLSQGLVEAGKFAQAVQASLAAVHAEPLRESASRALIRAHLAEGNRVEALRQYSAYRRLLRSELGLSPTPQMEQLVASLHTATTMR